MSGEEHEKPEWVPKKGGKEFTTRVMKGVPAGQQDKPGRERGAGTPRPARKSLEVSDYVEGIRKRNRSILARAITLIESNAHQHQRMGQEVLDALMGDTGNCIRVGITGVPGAGKSTLIDNLGNLLCERGHKVAVLAVDPSSTLTRGSILGDKTRMEKLSRRQEAFIRPSPTGGCLGGVARKSRETMLLCEAFGFDVVLLETVGVGQSEVTVRSMVDFFTLTLIAGAGDELQGIKKGVIELADSIIINKADGDNERRARMAKAEYNRVLHFLQPATEGWKTKAQMASALTGTGVPEIWETVEKFCETTRNNGVFEQRRRHQNIEWMRSLLDEAIRQYILQKPDVKQELEILTPKVADGEMPVVKAIESIMKKIE